MIFISVITGFLLLSTVTLEGVALKLILGISFLAIGALALYRLDVAYLAFLLLFPLVPSQPEQVGLPSFHFEEFLLLSLGFWWSLKNAIGKRNPLNKTPLARPIAFLLLFWAFSAFLALLRYNILFSEPFLLKLKEHWNVFLPWEQLDRLGPLRTLLIMSEGALFYFITFSVLDHQIKANRSIHVFFFSAVSVSILGILQHWFQFQLLPLWLREGFSGRINSTFADPNSLGIYLAAALAVGWYALLPSKKHSSLLPMALIACALILSVSRSGWAAACIILFLLPPVIKWAGVDATAHLGGILGWISKWAWIPFLALILAFILRGTFFEDTSRPKPLIGVIQRTLNPRTGLDRVLKGRVGVWKAAVQIFKDDPLYGNGLGTFPYAIFQFKGLVPPFYLYEQAHNDYLQILAETGIIGFFLLSFLVSLILWYGFRFLRSGPEPRTFLQAYAFLCGILVFPVASFAQYPILIPKLQLVFWALTGILLAIVRNSASPFPHLRLSRVQTKALILLVFAYAPFQIHSIQQTRQVYPYEYGFHDWEYSPDGPFRWTRKRAASLLRVEGKVLNIDLSLLNGQVQQQLPSAEIFLDDRLLDRITFQNTRWQHLSYYLPGYNVNQIAQVELRASTVFVPEKLGINKDDRTLGLATRPFTWEASMKNQPVGLYNKEMVEGREFCWTHMQASFPLEGSGTKLRVPLFLNNPVLKDAVDVLLYWNEQIRAKVQIQRIGWKDALIVIPNRSPHRGVLTVKVSQTWNPGRAGISADFRELGVGVGQIEWLP